MLTRFFVLVSLLNWLCAPVWAAPDREQSHTIHDELSQLIQVAHQHRPDLQAADYALQSLRQKKPASRALPDPNLMIGLRNVGFTQLSIGEEAMSGQGIKVQQKYPHPEKLNLREALAQNKIDQAHVQWQEKRAQLKLQIQTTYFQLLETQHALSINREIQALYLPLHNAVESYYKVGKVHQQDVWQVKVQRSKIEQQALELQRQKQLRLIELKKLLGWPEQLPKLQFPRFPEQLITIPPQGKVSLIPLWQLSQAQLQAAMIKHDLAKTLANPDFSLSGGVTQRLTLEPLWEIQWGMTLPIYQDEKIKPEILAAKAEILEYKQLLKQTEQNILHKAANAVIDIQESQRQYRFYTHQLLPETRLSFDASLAAYIVGKSDVTQVIQNLRNYWQFQMEALRLKKLEYLAFNQLEYFSGESLI